MRINWSVANRLCLRSLFVALAILIAHLAAMSPGMWGLHFLAWGQTLRAETIGKEKKGTALKKPLKKASPEPRNEASVAADDDGPTEPPPQFEYETVKLTDGMKLKVEKWAETFKGYDARPPFQLDSPQIEEIVDFQKLKRGDNVSIWSLQIDSEAGRIYWSDGYISHPVGRIATAKVDGSQVKDLATGLLSPEGLVLDRNKKKAYWFDGQDYPKIALKSIECGGNNPEIFATRFKSCSGAAAYDAKRGEFYYFEEKYRIIRIKPGEPGEELFLDGKDKIGGVSVGRMEYDPVEDKLYFGNQGFIRRANRDGTAIEDVVRLNGWGHIISFAVDVPHGKVYWVNSSYGQLCRANLDGSQVEIVILAPSAKAKDSLPKHLGAVALDVAHRKLYWSGVYASGPGSMWATISRTNLPSVLKATERPSPPSIASFSPTEQPPGGDIRLTGTHLRSTSAVSFIDDSTRKHVSAKFNVIDDGTIVVTVPMLADSCQHPVIVVQSPSGVTMTLSKALKAAIPSKTRTVHDRFRGGLLPEIWLTRGSTGVELEQALAYVEPQATFRSGAKGEMTVFAKSGSRIGVSMLADSVLYHEPFVAMTTIAEAPPSLRMIPVPAIRPSFVEKPFEYDGGK